MKTLIITLSFALFFNACGTTEYIDLTAQCNETNDKSTYQVLQSGDRITKAVSSSEVKIQIFHTDDGLKKACIKTGTAVIVR